MGRYVDAELLQKMFKDAYGIDISFDGVPTADVAPVVHAHWIKTYNHIKCSNCGVVFFNQPSDKFKTYCSKCGAIMDEEVKQ